MTTTTTTAATVMTVAASGRLFDILCPPGGDGVVLALRDTAAQVQLGQIDSEHAKVLGTKVSEWPQRDLTKELEKALEVDPYALLLKAWAQLRKVREAIGNSKLDAKPQTVTLAKHEVDAVVQPRIVISAFGVDCRAIELTLTLAASIESAQLVFERGGLTEATMGKPTGTLSVAVAGQAIASGKRKLAFAPSVKFDRPIFLDGGGPTAANHG